MEIEKKKNITLKTFQKLPRRLSRVLRTIRAGGAKALEEMFTRKVTKIWAYLEILEPYLNNLLKKL